MPPKNRVQSVVTDERLDQAFGVTSPPPPPPPPELDVPDLYSALAWVQARLPRVIKGETAKVHSDKANYSYRYADLADITQAILPLLGQAGLSWVTMPMLTPENHFVLRYKLTHWSKETLTGDWPLPHPANTAPQAVGSALTYARRYALCAVTGVSPDGDDDGAAAQAAHQDRSARRPEQETRPAPPPAGGMPPEVAENIKALVFDLKTAPETIANLWDSIQSNGCAQVKVSGDPRGRTWEQIFNDRGEAIRLRNQKAQETKEPDTAGGDQDPPQASNEATTEPATSEYVETDPWGQEDPDTALAVFRDLAEAALTDAGIVPALKGLIVDARTEEEFVIVADTVKKAHRRDQLISDATRNELADMFGEAVAIHLGTGAPLLLERAS